MKLDMCRPGFARASGLVVGILLSTSVAHADEKFFPATENGVPGQYGVTLLGPTASSSPELLSETGAAADELASRTSTAEELVASVGGKLGYVYRHVLNGFEAMLSDYQAERLSLHPMVKRVVQETFLRDPLSDALPHCYEGYDFNTRPSLPPLPNSSNPVRQQAIDCADPIPGPMGDCIDNWGIDRIDRQEPTDPPLDATFGYRQTGTGVKVYVLDTGVAAVNQEFDNSSGATRVANGIDTACIDFPNNCNFGNTACGAQTAVNKGHGTHVAAILGGRTFGLARGVSIIPIKTSCPGSATSTNFKRGIDHVFGIHLTSEPTGIVNISGMNDPCYADLECTDGIDLRAAVIALAGRNNILIVQSAGNQSGTTLSDACDHSFGDESRYTVSTDAAAIARIFVVAGSNNSDGRWRDPGAVPAAIGSNIGACVDIFAPASHVVSAYYPAFLGSTDPEKIVCQLSGTSMAAPHVTGVAAMILQESPTMGTEDLKTTILKWAEVGALESVDTEPDYIGDESPNRLVHWNSRNLFRDGFETEDERFWIEVP